MNIVRDKRGGSLIVVMLAMFMITSATVGVLLVTANSLHLNNRQRAAAEAFNVAESGAEMAALWLKNLPSPPNYNSEFDPFGGKQIMGTGIDGTYEITIYPGIDNAASYLKIYRIVSVGNVRNVSKTIEVVVRQASFGRYAYFTDKETSSISGGAIWWKAGEVIDGPVHSNNRNGSNFSINYNGSSSPIFLDMVTSAGTAINYTPSKPKKESVFKNIFLNGSKGFKLGVTPILLPESSDTQKNAAWGSQAGFPSKDGVYLRADSTGGVYIQGDAAIQLAVDANNNQKFIITQGTNVTTVTLDKFSETITTSGPMGSGSVTSAASLGNGVIYCTGNITSLKGEVADNKVIDEDVRIRSSFTIAADVNAGKYIGISDNLVYHTRPDKTLDNDDPVNLAAGTLGLVAKDIKILSKAPGNLEIDAVCLAGGSNTTSGSFYVENYDTKKTTGNLAVLGGIIQKSRGPVGTFDANTGKTMTGYSKNYTYDPRLASNPPPYYPTTGQYERLSWRLLPNSE
ncbi:MAG: hypothetical protein ABFD46_12660 [Armatimonadota bacterium]